MKLLDTNVIMYARGAEHPSKRSSQAVLKLYGDGALECNIDIEVLQEILHAFHSRGETRVGVALLRNVASAFPRALPVSPADMSLAADILVRYPTLQSRDAVHAAIVIQHRLEGIISTDRGFDIIEGLTRFDPKELAA